MNYIWRALWFLQIWTLRIVFFPVWMALIWRRRQAVDATIAEDDTWSIYNYTEPSKVLEPEPEPCDFCKGKSVGLAHGYVMARWRQHWDQDTPFGTCPECWVKPEPKKTSHWTLQILNKRGCILGQEQTCLVDEDDEGLVFNADFHIDGAATLTKSRVLRKGKIISTFPFPAGPLCVARHDIVKVRHMLKMITKPNPEPRQGQCGMATCQNIVVLGDRLCGAVICKTCAAKQKVYSAIEPGTWMGKKFCDLDDKHLWNIIQAVNTGQWANGKPASFLPGMTEALINEYQSRSYSVLMVKKLKKKKKNKKYEESKKYARW